MNEYVNKVVLTSGTTLIDISDTTATADKVLSGYGCYGADGAWVDGTAPSPIGTIVSKSPFYELGVLYDLTGTDGLIRCNIVDNVPVPSDSGTNWVTDYISKTDFINQGMSVTRTTTQTPLTRFYDSNKNYIGSAYRLMQPNSAWMEGAEYIVLNGNQTIFGTPHRVQYNKRLDIIKDAMYDNTNVDVSYATVDTTLTITADSSKVVDIQAFPLLPNETYQIKTSGYITFNTYDATGDSLQTIGGTNANTTITTSPAAIVARVHAANARTTFQITGKFPYIAKIKNYFGDALDSISSGDSNLGEKTITANGTYTASDDDLDGYSEVTVNVPTPAPNLQTKNVSYTPTTSSQSAQVTADSGYDGLEQVNVSVGAIPSQYIIPSGTKSITENGTGIDVTQYASVDVAVPTGASKNVQVVQGTTRTTSSTMTAIGAEMTVSKTGTYDVYWSGFRSSTSSSYTYATQLYVNGTAYGSENATWSNHVQNNHLSNISLTANQKIRVRGRNSRGSSYYIYAPTLVIVEA